MINIDKQYRKIINKFKRLINKKNYILEVHIVSENVIKIYNNRHRKINKPTDVLSFNLDDNFGIIFLCPKYIKKKIYEKHVNIDDIYYVFAHGLAHLAGFDHKNNMDQKNMDEFVYELLI